MNNFFSKQSIKITFLFLFLIELLSFFAWLKPSVNFFSFLLILLITLILSLKKLTNGLYIIFAELFIGSYGYLFSLTIFNFKISLRIGLFVVVMLVWLLNFLSKDKNHKNYYIKQFKEIKTNHLLKFLLFLSFLIIWGLFWGIIQNNGLKNIFFDFNNWLYFLLVLPLLSVCCSSSTDKFFKDIFSVLAAAVIWLTIKTVFLFYVFTHQLEFFLPEIYRWVRDSRIGEITFAGHGLWRVFIQSQIYSLLSFFIFLPLLFKKEINKKEKIFTYIILISTLLTTIISLSRSYWLGLAFGLVVYLFFVFFKKIKFKIILQATLKIVSIFIISLGFFYLILNLPSATDGNLSLALNKRLNISEPASSSRLAQLKPLFFTIAKHPLIGSGFGQQITYHSNDPRVLEQNPNGNYTTYAFEWGYFDIWLKIGLFGLIIYLLLIWKIIKNLLSLSFNNICSNGLILAIISLLAVNMFSPYFNHPLGIGFILLSLSVVYAKQRS